jgi:hypothetical protein
MPGYLRGDSAVSLSTSSRFTLAVDAVRNNRPHAVPATVEYFTALGDGLEAFRLDPQADPFDDAVVANIGAFLPYRNQTIDLFLALGLYLDTTETRSALHRFFEGLIPYLERPADLTQWKEWDFDNFRFVVHELFLYAVAALVRHERFDAAAHLMTADYFVSDRQEYGREPMVPFAIFRQYMRSLDQRNERLGLRRLSLRADLLKERCTGVALDFKDLMQADFILFMSDHIRHPDRSRWWPETLLYADRFSRPFEVFARSQSTRYFERAKVMLGVATKDAVAEIVDKLDYRDLPRWQFETFAPAALLGVDQLATRP